MTKTASIDFFTKEASQLYDERNRLLAPITNNMHFLIRLILRDFPVRTRVVSIPTTDNSMADYVIGQPNFTTNSTNSGSAPTDSLVKNLQNHARSFTNEPQNP